MRSVILNPEASDRDIERVSASKFDLSVFCFNIPRKLALKNRTLRVICFMHDADRSTCSKRYALFAHTQEAGNTFGR